MFTELTIYISLAASSFYCLGGDQVRGWNSVDDVLDRLSLCEDVTLVVRPQNWVVEDKLKESIEKYFPLMWENERVALAIPPRNVEDAPGRRIQRGPRVVF